MLSDQCGISLQANDHQGILANGEIAEWSKARDSKSRNPHKGFEGSNPSLSAISGVMMPVAGSKETSGVSIGWMSIVENPACSNSRTTSSFSAINEKS